LDFEFNLTRTAVAVKPALVDPTPVVNTARGIIFATYFKKKDFPVPRKRKKCFFQSNIKCYIPGSPINNKCG
jgi:hypothetical protein